MFIDDYDPDEAIRKMHPDVYEEKEVGHVTDNVRNNVIDQIFGESIKKSANKSFNKNSIQGGLSTLLEKNGYDTEDRNVQNLIGMFLENLSRIK